MRDDLYKTVPPTSNWRKVLRLACSKADWVAANLAIKSAVEKEVLNRLDKKWLNEFKARISRVSGDLFDHDIRPDIIAAHRKVATDELERDLCDIALGLYYRNRPGALFEESVAALEKIIIDRNIEHICSVVRRDVGIKEARSAGRELREIANMKVEEKVAAEVRTRKRRTSHELLDQLVSVSP